MLDAVFRLLTPAKPASSGLKFPATDEQQLSRCLAVRRYRVSSQRAVCSSVTKAINPAAFKGGRDRRSFMFSTGSGNPRAVALADIIAGDHAVDLAVYHVALRINKPPEDLPDAAAGGQLIHLRLIDKAVFKDRTLRAQRTNTDKITSASRATPETLRNKRLVHHISYSSALWA